MKFHDSQTVRSASTVQVSKAIGDKTYIVYEAVPIAKKKTVYIGSAFFAKKRDIADRGNTPRVMASEEASAPVSTLTVTEPSASVKSSSQKLAETLRPLLQKGTAFNSAFLFEQADKAFGGTQAQGVYTPKDAYDAMELAVNEYLLDFARDFNGDAKTAVRAINKLQNLVDKLPTQTKRTAEMESFQQFSTPPTIAFLAAWAADITSADTVLEPSAGIGGLAVYPKAWGAQTVVNELSKFCTASKLHYSQTTPPVSVTIKTDEKSSEIALRVQTKVFSTRRNVPTAQCV